MLIVYVFIFIKKDKFFYEVEYKRVVLVFFGWKIGFCEFVYILLVFFKEYNGLIICNDYKSSVEFWWDEIGKFKLFLRVLIGICLK